MKAARASSWVGRLEARRELPGSSGTIDPLEARLRLDSVWAGAGVTIIIRVPALIYALTETTADRTSGQTIPF